MRLQFLSISSFGQWFRQLHLVAVRNIKRRRDNALDPAKLCGLASESYSVHSRSLANPVTGPLKTVPGEPNHHQTAREISSLHAWRSTEYWKICSNAACCLPSILFDGFLFLLGAYQLMPCIERSFARLVWMRSTITYSIERRLLHARLIYFSFFVAVDH